MATVCPRCGTEIPSPEGRGRPRLWCSTECRRLAFEARRAARETGQVVEIREEIRERVVERSRPLSPDGAVDRVLENQEATMRLLRVLAYRWRHDPPQSAAEQWQHQRYKPLIADLWQAFHDAPEHEPAAMPAVIPADWTPPANRAQAHREAVALVLDSPRSLRDILTELIHRARAGELARGEHTSTVTAARELYTALVASRTIRP
jgi:hypothetical protein